MVSLIPCLAALSWALLLLCSLGTKAGLAETLLGRTQPRSAQGDSRDERWLFTTVVFCWLSIRWFRTSAEKGRRAFSARLGALHDPVILAFRRPVSMLGGG